MVSPRRRNVPTDRLTGCWRKKYYCCLCWKTTPQTNPTAKQIKPKTTGSMIVLSGRLFKHNHYSIHLYVELVEKLLLFVMIQTNSNDLYIMVNVELQNAFQISFLQLLHHRK